MCLDVECFSKLDTWKEDAGSKGMSLNILIDTKSSLFSLLHQTTFTT